MPRCDPSSVNPAPSPFKAIDSYLALTKPRLLPLVLLSGLPALILASGGWPAPGRMLSVLAGIALASGAANALNCFVERETDARMERTRGRPLPAGRLEPRRALVFGLLLTALGPGVLWASGGVVAAGIAVAAILIYVLAYTLWLKPRSALAALVGGVSGAVAPLIADAAITGGVGWAGGVPFLLVFVWQPPHFWAVSVFRRREYEAAQFPLLAATIGEAATRGWILAWIGALIPVSLLPVGLGLLGPPYAVAAIGLGGWYFHCGLRLHRERDDAAARRVFRASLVYLMAVLAAMILDLALGAAAP